ncbi:MAG: hypothetical protein JXA04_00665 [Gammaproteobacteria bacterium]|nr:hypothetical protein [Gammaproteobacteria bacterium]
MKITTGILLSLMILFACKNSDTREAVPARIIEPTIESRADLHLTVANALHNSAITLADDALTRSSVLIIERKLQRDADNNRIMGRDFGTPEQFHLVLINDQCVLIQKSTGNQFVLSKTHCVAE